MMKKLLYIIPVVCLLLACSKEPELPSSGLRDLSFDASLADRVKSSYFGTGSLEWSDGDRLSVFDGVGNREFMTVDSGPMARFFGQVDKDATSVVAVYPYDSAHGFTAPGTLSLVFPNFQTAVQGGFTDGANPSVGSCMLGSSDPLLMMNVGSYLKFTILESSNKIEAVYIEANSSESLSGRISVDISGSAPVSQQSGGLPSVTLVPQAGMTSFAPGSYYAVVNPVTLESGLSVTVRRSDGKVGVKKGTSQNVLERNHSKDLGIIDPDSMEWKDDAAYASRTLTLDFSSNPFTESLPSSKSTGLKTYYTEDNLPFTFYYAPNPSVPNTRGIGYLYSGGRLGLYASTYYGYKNTPSGLDRITLPAIPGKRLHKVTLFVGTSNSFQSYIVDSDWELVTGGMDTNPENWNSSGNWLAGKNIEFNLSGTTPGTEYHIVASGKNQFTYIARLVLEYETILPAHPSSDMENVSITPIGETQLFGWD